LNYVPELDGRLYALILNTDKKLFIFFEEKELIKLHSYLLIRNKGLADKIGALLNQVGDDYGVNPNMKK